MALDELYTLFMKTIEAVIPQASVQSTVEKLNFLSVDAITVESVKVFKKDLHRTMIYRGCVYEQNFDIESKLHFNVSDEDAFRAETILAGAADR